MPQVFDSWGVLSLKESFREWGFWEICFEISDDWSYFSGLPLIGGINFNAAEGLSSLFGQILGDNPYFYKCRRFIGLKISMWRWTTTSKLPPGPKVSLVTMHFDYSDSQISSSDSFYANLDYPMDSYLSSSGRGSYSGG